MITDTKEKSIELVECEVCGYTAKYEGGCFLCPRCGTRECNPYVKRITLRTEED
jgi:rubrerythrin